MDKFTTERKIEVLNQIRCTLSTDDSLPMASHLCPLFICHCFEFHTKIPYGETFDYLPELWNNRPNEDYCYLNTWDESIEEKKKIITKTIKQLESYAEITPQ